MSMKRIPIAEASPAELREYAEVILGLQVSPSNNANQLIAKIEQANPGVTEIIVSEKEAYTPEPEIERMGQHEELAPKAQDHLMLAYQRDPKVRLEIPSHPGAGGQTPISVAVNGVAFSLKRDVEMDVPFRVFEALKNAREHIREQVGQAVDGVMNESNRSSVSYPYNVIEMPPRADVEKWREETDALTV